MNMLYTSTSYPPAIGGAQLYLHYLAQAMQRDHSVHVATLWDTNRVDWILGTTLRAPAASADYCIDGVPVHRLGFTPFDKASFVPGLGMYALDPSRAARWLARPMLRQLSAYRTDADLIHNTRIGREAISYASFGLARSRHIPFVFTPNHHPKWVGWKYKAYLDLYRQADALIALTPSERETFIGMGVDPSRIHVVGAPGFLSPHPDGEDFRKARDITGPMVLFVGQKHGYKGFDTLLEATPHVWREHPDATFVFIGPRTPYSERLFPSYHDKRIIEIGAVSLEEKSNAIAACDIFCMPSMQESFGHVFVEAWTLGKPVIAGDIPAERDLIQDGVDGFLVSPAATTLATRISQLLGDAHLRHMMGNAGNAKVAREYSMEMIVRKFSSVYEAVIDR